MQDTYQVYVMVDQQNCVTNINSSAFMSNVENWVQIDEGKDGLKYGHAQSNYFQNPIYTEDGYPRYKLVDSKVVERTQEELDCDRLVDMRDNLIAKSKSDLKIFLSTHPIQWTDGQIYSITEEKQNQLMGIIIAAQLDGRNPEWNTMGDVCKEWKLEDLTVLAIAIKDRIHELVKYQQTKEIQIKNATTIEELNSIQVDYIQMT